MPRSIPRGVDIPATATIIITRRTICITLVFGISLRFCGFFAAPCSGRGRPNPRRTGSWVPSGTYQISRPSSDRIRHSETTPHHEEKHGDMISSGNRGRPHRGYWFCSPRRGAWCLRLWYPCVVHHPGGRLQARKIRHDKVEFKLLFDKAQNILTRSHTSVTGSGKSRQQ